MPGRPAGRTTGSPADLAGLCAGDIVTAVDGTSLDASYPFDLVIS